MALTPNFAASVTIADLPTGTTVTGAELFEAVQTGSGGFAQSIQISASQIAALAFGSTSVMGVASVGTALATAGTALNQVAFVADGGIGSTQIGAFAVLAGNIATNAVGTTQLATSIGLTGTLSVGGAVTFGSTLNVTGTTVLAVGPVISNFTAGFLAASSTGVVTSRPGIGTLTVGTSLATTTDGSGNIVGFVANAGIGSTQLGALAVQQSNITAAAVGSTQLGLLAVQRANVTAAAIGSTQLDSFAVLAANIATNAVGTAQLATSIGLTGTLSVGGAATFGGILNVTGTATFAVGPVISNFGSGFLQASSTGVVTSSGLVVMTAAQYRADTANKILSTDTTWGAAASVALTDATTVGMDFSTFVNATLTGTGGVGSTRTLGAATNVKVGQCGLIEWFPVTGATTLVVPTSSSYVSAGGISTLALSTTNGAQDAIIYTVLSTNKVLLAIQKAVAT